MSGGAYEYVMGNLNKEDMNFGSIDSKYYDLYTEPSVSAGKLGDSTKETQRWYGDRALFVDFGFYWFLRGGGCSNGSYAGVFAFDNGMNYLGFNYSWRVVLSSE